jgi:hypothetical protein
LLLGRLVPLAEHVAPETTASEMLRVEAKEDVKVKATEAKEGEVVRVKAERIAVGRKRVVRVMRRILDEEV